MKIWQSYGSEHSLSLVIIGKFKEDSAAEEFVRQSNAISNFLAEREREDKFDFRATRYGSETLNFLSEKNINCLTPEQLGHFLMDNHIERRGNEVHISSDDDIMGFISLLIHYGAKVETFSAHDYPESE